MEGATIRSFDVNKGFLDNLRKNAVVEDDVKFFKDSPIKVDLKVNDQYGIRSNQFQELQESIIQGTGKNVNK
jgi:hypothetical protein